MRAWLQLCGGLGITYQIVMCVHQILPAHVQVVPTRKVRGKKKAAAAVVAAMAADDGVGGAAAGGGEVEEEDEEEGGGGGFNPEDLLPRADISGSITPALLGMIASANWKERNAGVDQVGGCGARGHAVLLAWPSANCAVCAGAQHFVSWLLVAVDATSAAPPPPPPLLPLRR